MQSEPRWPATVAVLAVGGIYFAIPEDLSLGPRWLLLVVMILLAVPALLTHRAGLTRISRRLGIISSLILTVDLIWSVALLVSALPMHRLGPQDLLRSAAAIWTTNVLVFALWYWRLDSGSRAGSEAPAFLFPQLAMRAQQNQAVSGTTGREPGETEYNGWFPNFLDYLFIAFNTSTAFSPTDTPPLTRWAKALMMVQSTISLLIIALLAARAVNIL